MPDPDIQLGDVVHDLGDNGKRLQVLGRAADTVAAYREREDRDLAAYKAHPLLDVRADEPVYTCVYLPGSPSVEFAGTYDFPRSRLARAPVEEANAGFDRVQSAWTVDLLADLFAAADRGDLASSPGDLFDLATHAGVDDTLVEEARELAAAETLTADSGGGGDE